MRTILRFGIMGGLLLAQTLSYAAGNHSIAPKLGQYNLDSTTQTITKRTSIFEKNSNSVGVEYQYGIADNMTIGGSVDRFKHSYNSLDGEMETALIMFNYKYIVPVTTWFNPYVGASVGIAVMSLSGSISGRVRDTANGINLGVAFPINDKISIAVEYRKVTAKVTGELNGTTTEVDASGNALTANLTITF